MKEPPKIDPRLEDLCEAVGNTKDKMDGKLGPTWEGPYEITKIAQREGLSS